MHLLYLAKIAKGYSKFIIPWYKPNHWNIAYIENQNVYYFEPLTQDIMPCSDFEKFLEMLLGNRSYKLKCLKFTEQKNSWHCGYLCLIVILKYFLIQYNLSTYTSC